MKAKLLIGVILLLSLSIYLVKGAPLAQWAALQDDSSVSAKITALKWHLVFHPDDIYTRRDLARAYLQTQQFKAAHDEYQILYAEFPGDRGIILEYATLLRLSGRDPQQLALLLKQIEAQPDKTPLEQLLLDSN